MQKAIRINILARNNAAKRYKKGEIRRTKGKWKEWHDTTNRVATVRASYLKEERKVRREDWLLGPLAPNRASGREKGVYGTVGLDLIQSPMVPPSVSAAPKRVGYAAFKLDHQEDPLAFKGDTIVGNVLTGDRVVIVNGPERLRGIVGTVSIVDNEKEEVKLTNINNTDVRVPAYVEQPATEANPNPPKFNTVEAPIPMSYIRLVMKIIDDDGVEKDVIIRHVHAGPPYTQQALGSHLPAHTRYMTGAPGEENIPLPWPEDHIEDDFVHSEGDTTRVAVQNPTWVPILEGSPLGYDSRAEGEISFEDNPYSRAPELLTMDVNGVGNLNNIQRVGLNGFVDDQKLQARQTRIANGIMNELRTKQANTNSRHDDSQWVKRKFMEDARAIWYQQRKMASPETLAHEARVKADEEARKKVDTREDFVRNKTRLALLIREMRDQKGNNPAFQPDPKFEKDLARLAVRMNEAMKVETLRLKSQPEVAKLERSIARSVVDDYIDEREVAAQSQDIEPDLEAERWSARMAHLKMEKDAAKRQARASKAQKVAVDSV